MTYAEKLKDPRWQKKRLEIFERDDFKCQLCGDSETTLHIHHKEYHKDPWEVNDEFLITYCKHCHSVIEESKEYKNIVITRVFKEPSATLCSGFTELFAVAQGKINYGIVIFRYNDNIDMIESIGLIDSKTINNINNFLKNG